jgi:NAD(P)-dependent dehydrogenase (short-subunit alcohol dehydrogenase family)
MPTVGLEGGRINLVPVEFVVNAVDHIAHQRGLDGRCFHLVDPHPHRVGDVLAIFAKAAHAPEMAMRVNAALFEFIPGHVRKALLALTPVQRIRRAVMHDLGLPEGILTFVNYPTRFDSREAQAALAGSGIEVPPLESYAWRLWDYWERHLDPDLKIDRSLQSRVRGKVALVTGGSSGIGLALARALREDGYALTLVARRPEPLAEAADDLGALAVAANLGDPDECVRIVAAHAEHHGGLDLLVNSAGLGIGGAFAEQDTKRIGLQVDVNLRATLVVTREALPLLRASRGQIITLASIAGTIPTPGLSVYGATKAALIAWTSSLNREEAEHGVRATAISPAFVATRMTAWTGLADEDQIQTDDIVALVRAVLSLSPMARVPNIVVERLGDVV